MTSLLGQSSSSIEVENVTQAFENLVIATRYDAVARMAQGRVVIPSTMNL